jgi:hypothetical protein
MKRAIILLPLILLIMMSGGCAKHHNPTQPDGTGNMPILMNLEPAFTLGFHVTRVNVQITKGDFSDQMDMVVDSTTANGTFTDLEIGTYAIDVNVYDDTQLIATGQGTAIVSPGQTTTAHITLQFVPGGLEVVVNWGLPYEECRRILLVGNSHTYYNEGVYTHLQALIDAAHPEWGVVVEGCTQGGYTLENHMNDQTTLNTIATGNWDLVILQEQSSRPMNEPQLFYQYSAALDSVITHNGALTGFYMTWAWRNNPEMYVPIRDAYNYIGAYLDALVNPCGIAFYNSVQADSTVNLYSTDNYHPSLNGTYLASCVMLANIWNVNPVGSHYVPTGIDPGTAAFLQQIAWNTVQDYRATQQNRLVDKLSLPHRSPVEVKWETALAI